MHLTAEIFMAFFVAFFALITVGLLAAFVLALRALNSKIDKLTTMAEPAINKVSDTLDTVQRVTMNVGEKTDAILSRSETLTENVSGHVERTASVVQNTVTTPLINLSSVIAGVSKGFAVYGNAFSNKQNGRDKSSDHAKE
ncbi:MAG: hypothetical protein ABIY70_11765 [Capsulimonas sp.]|jgi:uncharacterized protein YoxC|uniref:hypothetical protein n=1 Tax=Capsulimonas sp. TaxID=2494211 RepID=UPI00326392EE|nr:hypothetical protein [Capsulimonas sp.]